MRHYKIYCHDCKKIIFDTGAKSMRPYWVVPEGRLRDDVGLKPKSLQKITESRFNFHKKSTGHTAAITAYNK